MQNLDAYSLHLFVVLAEQLHFGRAARAAGIAQPALSARIRRLEEEIGGRLFERDTRNVALSPLGSALLADAQEVDRRLADLGRRARSLASGRLRYLRLGYVSPALPLIAPGLATLKYEAPDLGLSLHRMGTSEQLRAIRQGKLEVGVARLFDRSTLGLKATRLLREQYVLAAPAAGPFARRKRIELSELAGHAIIGFPRDLQPGLFDHLSELLATVGARFTDEARVTTKDEALALVQAGLGMALVPRSIRRPAGVRRIMVRGPLPPVELHFVTRERREPMLERLFEMLRAGCP